MLQTINLHIAKTGASWLVRWMMGEHLLLSLAILPVLIPV